MRSLKLGRASDPPGFETDACQRHLTESDAIVIASSDHAKRAGAAWNAS